MKVRVEARDPLNGEVISTNEEINNLEDYRKMRAVVGGCSKAWINGLQIVRLGCISEDAYNKEDEILEHLLNGDIWEDAWKTPEL